MSQSETECYIDGIYFTCPLGSNNLPVIDGGIANDDSGHSSPSSATSTTTTNAQSLEITGVLQCSIEKKGSYTLEAWFPMLTFGICQCQLLLESSLSTNDTNLNYCDCYQCNLHGANFAYACYDAPAVVGSDCYNISCDGQCNVPIAPGEEATNTSIALNNASHGDDGVVSISAAAICHSITPSGTSFTQFLPTTSVLLILLYKLS